MTAATQLQQQQQQVGFDAIVRQIEKKYTVRGFHFNVMLVGASGLGKTTFINSLFGTHLVDSALSSAVGGGAQTQPVQPQQAENAAAAADGSTAEIRCSSFQIHDDKLRMKLNVIDTPGFGTAVNNEGAWEPLTRYIKDQYAIYLRKELSPSRDVKHIVDTRVHVVVYFIAPGGHALKPLDIAVMRKLADISNVIPVIAKADGLTVPERVAFKQRINDELKFHQIPVYPSAVYDDQEDSEELALNESIRKVMPFAISSSERAVSTRDGPVRGRETRYGGVVQCENVLHSDFTLLRNFLIKTHLYSMIETTANYHYEHFRTRQLVALKEASKASQH